MARNGVGLAALGLLAALCLAAPSRAEDPQQSFKSLVARGFKIVEVNVVPAEVSKTDYGTFVITPAAGQGRRRLHLRHRHLGEHDRQVDGGPDGLRRPLLLI